jgi:hypothetical protein
MRSLLLPLLLRRLLPLGVLCSCGDDGEVGDDGSTGVMATTTTMPGTSSSTEPPMTTSGPPETGSTTAPACACEDAARCDDEGRCRRYVFVSRDPLTLGEDGRSDANTMCSSGAAASDVLPGGDYVAFLAAADGLPPWDDIGLNNLDNAVFVLPDDTVVGTAAQLTGAQAGTDMLEHAIDQDQTGQPLHGDFEDEACAPDSHGVWTGVEASLFSGSCNAWSVDMTGYTGVVGNALAVNETWTASCSSGCSMFAAHVYCFESVGP